MSFLRLMSDPTVQRATGLSAGFTHSVDTMSPHSSVVPHRIVEYNTNAVYPTANLAIYIPLRVIRAARILKIWVATAGGAANIDFGVYSSAGTRLVSTGNIAKTVGIAEQVSDVTDLSIAAGLYYMALVCDNTTGSFARSAPTAPHPAALGILTEALGSAVLPATATWAVDNTLAYVPVLGMLVEGTVA